MLCFEYTEKCPLRFLLDVSQLECFADLICKRMLKNSAYNNGSALEVIIKQLLFCKKIHEECTKGLGLNLDINLKH